MTARPVESAAPPRPRGWDPLQVGLAVYLLTAVARVHQLFPAIAPLKPALLGALGAIALYLADSSPSRRFMPALHAPPTMCVLGLLIWAVFSIPGSLWPGYTFQLVFDDLLKTIGMYLVLVGACRDWKDVERLGLVYFAGIALYSGVVLSRFDVGHGAWRLNNLYYYDANDFATLAVMSLPLGLHFAINHASRAVRIAAIAGTACSVIAIIWAGSRGGFLAFIAVSAFLLFRFTSIPARWRVLGTGAMVALFVATASDAFWEKMGTTFKPTEDYNYKDSGGRLLIWRRGMDYMLDRPLLGVGAGNFGAAEGTLSAGATRWRFGRGLKWSVAHNSFVQAGAELGIPGLLLFVGAIGGAFLALRRVRLRRGAEVPPEPTRLAQALTASLIGFSVGGFFLSLAYSDMLYVLLGLAAALGKVQRPPPAAPAPVPVRRFQWQFSRV